MSERTYDRLRSRALGITAEVARLEAEVQAKSPLSSEEEQAYREKLNTLFFKISEDMRQTTLDMVLSHFGNEDG